MSIESFFQKPDWTPRLGARIQDFGSALQGQQGGNLQRYNQNAEREARKAQIAGLMENMGISGNRRAILGMLPVDAQASNLYDMLNQQDASSAQAARVAAFNTWMQGGQQGPPPAGSNAPISSGPIPPEGFPQSIVDAVTGVGGYNEGLSNTESGGNYGIVNSEGYGGRYQFGQARLDDYNRATGQSVTMDQFLASPQIQEAAQNWNVADTDQFIQSNGLNQYIGQTINGVPITQNGLRAMAHLGGNNGMKRFLESGGTYNPADSNGTHLSDYAATHAGGQAPAAQGGAPRIDPELARAIAFANDASLPPEQRAVAAAMVEQMTSEGTTKQQEYDQYVQQTRAAGGEPMGILEYQQALRSSGATNLTVNSGGGGVDYGTPDKGYMWARAQDGSIATEEYTDPQGRTFFRPVQIPKAGGNVEAETAQVNSEQAATQQSSIDTATRAIRAIDGAIDLVGSGFGTTGVMSAVTGLIPGSDRTDLLAKIEQLQAITGIESLADLRAAGGTTGALTEKEFERFASAIANFNPDQSAGALTEELRYLRSTFQQLVDDARANTAAPQSLGVGDTTTFNGMTIERVE